MPSSKVYAVDDMLGKICPRCEVWKPLETGYHKNKLGRHGVQSHCKTCTSTKAPRTTPEPRILTRDGLDYKLCVKCSPPQWKPLDAFYNNTYGHGGKHTWCKDCCGKANELHRKQNRERINANARKCRAADPARYGSYVKRYRAALPADVRKARDAVQNARRRDVPGEFSVEDILVMLEAQQYLCYYCGVILINSHIDHKIPVSRGGTNDPANLCITCAHCNLSKNAKTEDEFKALSSHPSCQSQ